MADVYEWIIGIDEAGRGPLAGPVAVGLVLIPASLDLLTLFPKLNDSKKISEKVREEIFVPVKMSDIGCRSLRYSVQFSDAKMIDEKGIVYAINDAMQRGLTDLKARMSDIGCHSFEEVKVFLDGALRAPESYQQETIIGGDGKVPAIMLASVLAKVTRDRYMTGIAPQFPHYAFDRHKGYGTKAHIEEIKLHSLSSQHRKTFCKNIIQ